MEEVCKGCGHPKPSMVPSEKLGAAGITAWGSDGGAIGAWACRCGYENYTGEKRDLDGKLFTYGKKD